MENSISNGTVCTVSVINSAFKFCLCRSSWRPSTLFSLCLPRCPWFHLFLLVGQHLSSSKPSFFLLLYIPKHRKMKVQNHWWLVQSILNHLNIWETFSVDFSFILSNFHVQNCSLVCLLHCQHCVAKLLELGKFNLLVFMFKDHGLYLVQLA